jgi:SAM-dependent methyltransferase
METLERERLEEVLSADFGYYRGPEPIEDIDNRLHPATGHLLASSLSPDRDVLDIGCGDGSTLLSMAGRIRTGVGIDNDPEHLDLAEQGRRKAAVNNVSFEQLVFAALPDRGWEDRFDVAFSERGPVGYSVSSVLTALSVLKPGGLLLAEVIGDLHHQEVRQVFGGPRRQPVSVLDTASVAFERAGVDIRLAANLISRRTYPDVYEWLKFQCSIWAWSGAALPNPDDPRLHQFAQMFSDARGRIVTTHHVVLIGGTKLPDGSPYGPHAT